MRDIRRSVKMGLVAWMFANPLIFLVVPPTQSTIGA